MESTHFIPIILGTGRQGRQSEKVANYIYAMAKKYRLFLTEIIDIRDYASAVTKPPEENDKVTDRWKKIVNKSSGIIIVSPEYNHSFPGELKILFDRLLKEYAGKPISICSVSNGYFGGARMVEQLLPYFHALYLKIILPAVYFPFVQKLFDQDGNIKDHAYDGKLMKLFENILHFIKK